MSINTEWVALAFGIISLIGQGKDTQSVLVELQGKISSSETSERKVRCRKIKTVMGTE